MTDEEVQALRNRYQDALEPLFLPADPVSNDIVNYFASLLRVVGMEDKGWDPHWESRLILEDINSILQMDLPADKFPDRDRTAWRMGLLMYSHIVEMDAPYEVIANLLRFQLGKGYSPNPFYDFLSAKQKKRFAKFGLNPMGKIRIIKLLAKQLNSEAGDLFDEFYDSRLRNAISHSDYILTDSDFRCRNGTGAIGAFKITLQELNKTITKAKTFISTFFGLDLLARKTWGNHKQKGVPYDPHYKGLLEVLVDDEDLMCGFKVHWPNHSESTYRRTKAGIDMVNCMLSLKKATIELIAGRYARDPSQFSPLVEKGDVPRYTRLEGVDEILEWKVVPSNSPSSA